MVKYISLNNCAIFSQGKQVPVEEQSIEKFQGSERFVRIVDFTSDNEQPRYIHKIEGSFNVKVDDLIMIRYGSQTAGKVVRGIKGIIANNMFKIDIDKNLFDINFAYYYLSSDKIYKMLMNAQSSSTMPAITFRMLGQIKLPLFTLETQQKIAKVLSAIDDKIELNNSINNNLEQQAQTIFKSWFVDFEPFGGTMPKLAELVPIENICKIVTKGTTPTTLGFSFVERGINFIKAESILDNHSFDYNKFAHIDEITHKKLSRSILEAKDIVFTIAGTLGRFAIIDEEVIPANTNQAVAIIRADIKKIEPEYLYTFFLGNWHNNYYSKRIQQAVQANLNLTTIKSLPIILLNQEYRIKYLNIIKPILGQIKYNEKENRILTQLRDTLLPKLMSGEIDVSKVEIL